MTFWLINCKRAQFLNYVETALPIIESESNRNEELNEPISMEELHNIVKKLKNGKSCYLDEISNEAIKSVFHIMAPI